MVKTWINYKPKIANEVWSSATARNYRSRHSKKETELKDTLETLRFPDLYDKLLSSSELEGLMKVIKQVQAFKKTLDASVEKGYIIEEPVLTVEEQKVVEKTERESVICESLLSDLKKEIGHGRKLQKFKHDNEMRAKFNRNLLDLYPVVFLQVPLIRNTLKNLYDNIDLSSFDLKQKEIDAEKPKVLVDKEYNKQIEEIEKKKKPKKEKPKPKPPLPEETESETDEKPSAQSIISKVDASEDIETSYEKLDDASDDDGDCRNLSKSIIQKRMTRNIREYKAFKAKLQTSSANDEEYPIFLANCKTAKTAAKRYKIMLSDFDKNEKKRNLRISEGQAFLNLLDYDSDDIAPEPKPHIIRNDNGAEMNLNDFYYTNKVLASSKDSGENTLTAGQLKQIEIELKLYLGVSEGWNQKPCELEDDEFEHYRTQNLDKTHTKSNIIIPTDFKDLIPMIHSERQNEYPVIIKRLGRHPKLTELASASKSNPKTVEKSLEKLFTEMKNLLKAK